MNQNFVKVALSAFLALGCILASAQEDEATPSKKKPMSKAMQEAKVKVQEKKRLEKAKAVDINRASLAELRKLPGITDAWAAAIVAKRPYHSKAELITKQVLPEVTYQGIRKLIAAK